ncbi:MAG: protein-glutamate O-methyltransferase CheR [Pirellulaceae bacterium]
MVQTIPSDQVTDAELRRYAKLIYDVAGIEISASKKQLLSNRLRRRLKETRIETFDAYYEHLRKLPSSHDEWDCFLQEITTHETYLFRDECNWKWIRETFLPELVQEARIGKRPRRIRVWSAACSTGDEAYSVATCIAEAINAPLGWDIKIVGTDIGIGAVAQAREAQFNARAVRLVPPDLLSRFFQGDEPSQTWQPVDRLRKMTQFKQHNLLNPLPETPFDLVLLKNVLIYFNQESKRRVIENLQRVVSPGAMVIGGAAEGISGMMTGFERLSPWLYRRQ